MENKQSFVLLAVEEPAASESEAQDVVENQNLRSIKMKTDSGTDLQDFENLNPDP